MLKYVPQEVMVSLEMYDIREESSLYLGGLKFNDQQGEPLIIYHWVVSPILVVR